MKRGSAWAAVRARSSRTGETAPAGSDATSAAPITPVPDPVSSRSIAAAVLATSPRE